jgi:hypothetical protein
VEFNLRDKTLRLLRASVATITSYMFFNRGECNACPLWDDTDRGERQIHCTTATTREGAQGSKAGKEKRPADSSSRGSPTSVLRGTTLYDRTLLRSMNQSLGLVARRRL